MTVETNNRYLYGADYPFLKDSLSKVGNPVLETYFALRVAREVYLPLGLHPGQRLLDVGCCLGHLGAVLGLGRITTVGIDLNRAALEKGLGFYGSRRNLMLEANAIALPFKEGSFDAVASQDLLEHCPSEETASLIFKEMERVLFLRERPRMVHKITVLEDEECIDADFSHFLKWSAQKWRSWFEQKGWKVIAPTEKSFPPFSIRNGFKRSSMHGFFLIERN